MIVSLFNKRLESSGRCLLRRQGASGRVEGATTLPPHVEKHFRKNNRAELMPLAEITLELCTPGLKARACFAENFLPAFPRYTGVKLLMHTNTSQQEAMQARLCPLLHSVNFNTHCFVKMLRESPRLRRRTASLCCWPGSACTARLPPRSCSLSPTRRRGYRTPKLCVSPSHFAARPGPCTIYLSTPQQLSLGVSFTFRGREPTSIALWPLAGAPRALPASSLPLARGRPAL